MRGREKFKRFQMVFWGSSKILSIFPMKFRKILLSMFRNVPGSLGCAARYVILNSIAPKCGANVLIKPHVIILHPEMLSIGENVSIHPYCYIQAHGGISIGNNVSIAHGVTLMTENHIYDSLEIPIKEQGIISKPIVINDNVWIGAKATILMGNSIGYGSIIAASAVVTNNVDNNTVVGGIPAKIIKKRS